MLLRYHDPAGWPMIREALLEMGKGHLIGNGNPVSQGTGQGKPANKGKTPTRTGSAKPGAKPATQGNKPAAKGNGTKRPAR